MNKEIVKHVNDTLIQLKKDISRIKFLKMKILKRLLKNLKLLKNSNFHNQQIGKGRPRFLALCPSLTIQISKY